MPTVSVILLAAGYGTRLQRDLHATPQLHNLEPIPKPLLPISGVPILTHWVRHLTHASIISTTVITNALHEPQFAAWRARQSASVDLITNHTTANHARPGAVADLAQALAHAPADFYLVIAGDTLLPATDVNALLDDFLSAEANAATLAYKLTDMADASRRGMLAVEDRQVGERTFTYATKLVEKPDPKHSPSALACAPVYLLRHAATTTVGQFLNEVSYHPLSQRDAPGFWLAWLIERFSDCAVYKVDERVDIGGLAHYKDALWKLAVGPRADNEPAIGRAFPRVGLLGNPSDGYGGKVIAFTLASEGFAEVMATKSDKFSVIVNKELEIGCEWDSVDGLLKEVRGRGLGFGARKLVLAAVAVFAEVYKKQKMRTLPNCTLSYSTTIPARVGLAGSSALVLATFRAIARFCGENMEEICSDVTVWPELMRKAEKDYLGIACGLMDRVVQVLHGVVFMDFSEDKWKWERLSVKLPDMWLAYSRENDGECSGKVHGGLMKRFLDGDQKIKEVTESLSALVDEAMEYWEEGLWRDLPLLFESNFALRCQLVGRDGVGPRNLRLVDVATQAGFSAKMTGSGGCALCIPNPVRGLSENQVDSSRREFEEAGFVLRKVQVLEQRQWVSLQKT